LDTFTFTNINASDLIAAPDDYKVFIDYINPNFDEKQQSEQILLPVIPITKTSDPPSVGFKLKPLTASKKA